MKTDCIVIGSGVIGLAIARKLSEKKEVFLFEKHPKFGEETSSRNSEVIHSGIYYPPDSLKTRWCIDGRQKLYRYCDSSGVPYRRCGKFLVATNEEEVGYIQKKANHCKNLEVPFEIVSKSKAKELLPDVLVEEALFFPESGIVDSHVFMQSLEAKSIQQSASILYRHEVKSVERENGKWVVSVTTADEVFQITADHVVNCGGLGAAKISNQALQVQRYEHRFCRGRYFNLTGKHPFSTLVYPVPPKDGLGVHVTLDLSGALRLGPDVDWSPVPSYECDWESLRIPFSQAARKYWPSLRESALSPGLIGIRPKLFVDGVAHTDFLVESLEGFVHCLGIESPGLTSALAIAENVSNLVEGL